MLTDIGGVLAEQQAVISLLLKRARAAEFASAADAETLARALFAHLRVLEHSVVPVFAASATVAGTEAALRMVATHLAAAVNEQQRGSMASYAALQDSAPMLFMAESLLLRDATKDELQSLSKVVEQAEEQFTLLIGRADFNEVQRGTESGDPAQVP